MPSPRPRIERALFLAILLGYVLAGALYAIYTPAWQAPDEPAHFNYARQVAEEGCCPRIEIGDWQSEYLAQLTTARFAPELLDRLDAIQYEDHHPPLYYLLASIVYQLSAGDLIALRLLSVALGAVVVCLSRLISREVFPDQPQVALGVMALVAFTPQHLSLMAAVNNDALAEVIVALALLWLLRCLKAESVPAWRLGLILGLALLTKLTIYFLALIVPLGLWLRWRRAGRPRSELVRAIAVIALVAGVMGGLWWLRNIAVYGFPDFLGLGAHDAVVADQPRSADYIARHGLTPYLAQMAGTTFKSFWGQFGWMALPLDGVFGGWIYRGFALLVVAGLSGLLLAQNASLKTGRERSQGRLPQEALLPLLATVSLVALQFIYYNIEFLQWQGRYLFPALIPISLGIVAGVDCWRGRFLARWPPLRWLTPLAMTSLFALDIYLLFSVIAPSLSPG